MCLPFKDYKESKIIVPRGEYRISLSTAGLIGKIEISSTMSEIDIRKEICPVFAQPMGLNPDCNDELFPFEYLQPTGQGSKCLCIPSTSSGFKWTAQQVAALSKHGRPIYIRASKPLPGYVNVSPPFSNKVYLHM